MLIGGLLLPLLIVLLRSGNARLFLVESDNA